MKTHTAKLNEVKREWHLIDAKGAILGRLSTSIAKLLMGKGKSYFSRNLDCGDYVVVINAAEVKLSGAKEKNKIYYHHSGYPAGLKQQTVEKVRETHPERLITHAVSGMLPQNKLKDVMLTKLYVYPDENHPYESKFLKIKEKNAKN